MDNHGARPSAPATARYIGAVTPHAPARHDAPRPHRTAAEHAAAVLTLAARDADPSTPSNGVTLGTERVALVDALGRVLAADVRSLTDLPPWDNSAMDGYAVRAADLAAAGSSPLPVVDVVAAGDRRTLALPPGTAMQIMTGAPVPAGADTVVPVESTDAGRTEVRVTGPTRPGGHIRPRGEDVRAHDVVLHAGDTLTPARLALAAGTGHGTLPVHRRPRVLVVSTGSELVAPGEPLPHGAIYESNSVQLAALARRAGATADVLVVPDDVATLRGHLAGAAARWDLVITSGGVSVGEFDVVRDALGAHLTLVHVAIQPGRPQGSGRLADGTPVVALPGNPVSSFVSFELFVRPLLRRLAGAHDLDRRRVRARLGEAVTSPPGREQYARVRVRWDGPVPVAVPVGGRGSHLMAALAGADGLAVVPADVTSLDAGATVDVLDLREDEA